jgi:uncharacterized protein YndB with AHSA1/START domain
MTITDKTDSAQTDALTFEYDLAHPPQKVWRALTDPALLAQWLLPVFDFNLKSGAAFTFKTQPQPGWDGIVNCRILAIDEPRTLRYAWTVGEGWLDTIVTFTLAATETGTRLTLVQSGFKPDQKQNLGGARYGWKMMGGRLIDLLTRIA